MKLEITKPQLEAIKSLADDISAMIGCADDPEDDKTWIRNVKAIDRMLKKNGLNRDFL